MPRVGWLGIALLVAYSACDGGCRKKKTTAVDASKEETAVGVEVITLGTEPRHKLEIGRWAGLTYHLQIQTEGSFGIRGVPPAKAPTSIIGLGFEVLRGTADPVIRERDKKSLKLVEERASLDQVELASSDLPVEVVDKLNASLALLKGSTAKQLVNEDGEVFEITTELVGGQAPPKEIKKILDDAFEGQKHFPFRLPPVAVGSGARWRFSEPLEMRGAKAMQTADMTLLGLGSRTARIAIRVRHQAPRQELPHPSEPGLTATLEQLRGDADGEITIDRLTAVVLAARLTTTAYFTVTWMDAEGHDQTSTFMSAQVQRLAGQLGTPDAGVDGGDAARPDAGRDASGEATVEDEDDEEE